MSDNEKAIKRLLKPSPVVNWTLNNLKRLDDTRKRLMNLAVSPPRHSLGPAYSICAKIAYQQLTLKEALEEAGAIGNPATRVAARELIPAFYSYAQRNKVEGVEELDGYGTPFPIGRSPDGSTLTIPVRPTFVAIEGDKLKPYFVVGWSRLAYDEYQKRLLSSIICKSLLTQEDYFSSDAQIVCLPRSKWSKRLREVREWSARSYGSLTDEELEDQFVRYTAALAQVVSELRGE